MRRFATSFFLCFGLMAVVVPSLLAGPPLNGVYFSTDMGGSVYLGRYSEGWVSGGPMSPGTTLNAESWDGSVLGSQWKYYCSTEMSPAVILDDSVDSTGTGTRTYKKTFVGGTIWLSGSGPWANGDPDYPGTILSYNEYETVSYYNGQVVGAVTNVSALAQFDNYSADCLTFSIGNGSLVGSTDMGMTEPSDFPPFLEEAVCTPTAPNGAWWNFFTITLTIHGCTNPTEETSWGAIKSMYEE